jgi:hypothetical protein
MGGRRLLRGLAAPALSRLRRLNIGRSSGSAGCGVQLICCDLNDLWTGGHSLRVTAGLAALQGIADISDVALMNRLAHAAPWLEALCNPRRELPLSQGYRR